MRKRYLLSICLMSVLSYGQVGINNKVPRSTLDVTEKTIDGSHAEGLMIPRETGNALKLADSAGVYGSDQDATLIFVTKEADLSKRTGQVEKVDSRGFYFFDAGINRWVKIVSSSNTNIGQITQLLCSSSAHSGVLTSGTPASGVTTQIPYNGGNGGSYSSLSLPSIGVTGLTAILTADSFQNGSGTLNFSITGTPAASGTATFNISLGGQTCSFSRTVKAGSSFADDIEVIIDGKIRRMKAHNVGADTSENPDIPGQSIIGDYFQWGRKDPVATAYTSSSAISGYNTTNAANKSWNKGSESIPQKNTLNDPCPSGYRVPTRAEWQGFITASTTTNIGTWALSATDGASNFSVAKVFKNNGNTITFPGGGNRFYATGALGYRGNNGNYWSSTENEVLNTDAYFMSFFKDIAPANYSLSRPYGFSVRCISE
ncbi:uncharacterized protein (TIGR02145 family) [Chryseobacterium sp. PvR013]|jgi:uncharacterized protein (TIGR02145 family)|uniref:FISUMP domain-containing protein n=1 Tax=Chryseobacterium sp. PvR013 TaxID=2806595 RepID=UPI001AE1A372|nr:FISUMP domain-containing protein [Chryseobacterium sp. PvR013]MBP1164681.1 uncharacterized protein (TIGR02145 family) [Chryseobacterium sp. PvR013]